MQANITRRRPFMPRRPHPDFEHLCRLYEVKPSRDLSDDEAGAEISDRGSAVVRQG